RLNAIIHPRVEALATQQLAKWASDGKRKAAFIEAALLVEAGYERVLDALVVTWCLPEQQLERLPARGLSAPEARKRIAAQLAADEKLRRTKYRIDCSGALEHTRTQVQALAQRLQAQP